MAIYRGEGGKTDVVPADGDQEFAGSIIAEKDIHAHGNISADGDITIGGDLHWEGTVTGDGSGLENVPTPFLQADDCIYLNNQVITNDYTMPVGKNGMTAGDITVNGELTIPDGSDWHVVGTEDGVVTLESLGIPNHDLVTVDETGHLTAFNVTSESPYVGDGSLLTGIPTATDLETITTQVETNTTNIQTNADAIQENADAIQANTDAIDAIPGAVDAYTKAEIDAQQGAQDTEINKKANTTDVDAKNALQDTEINKKVSDAPVDGEQYVRKDGVWAELAAADGGIADAPSDGKTYGRKNLKWEEVTSDGYTKSETDILLDNKANVGDSYTKAETYSSVEVDSSQALQDTEIAKKANQDTTYTKDEVDSLLESASGAIVGNYTNKWASSVARDPGAGNLYLVAGMDFTMKFEDATRIYISDTDGDGALRDFDEVKVDDILTVTSDNGQGVFKLMSVTDLTGYRELVLNAESASGTVANDTAVSLVLDVASSETGGGLEEAPEDGKQYGRQDKAWTEVNAGGTVADGCIYLNNQTIENDYTIPLGKNGMSSGPIQFDATVTVPDGTAYHVVDETGSGSGGGDSIWTIKNNGFEDFAFYDGPIEFKPNTTTDYNKDDILFTSAGHLVRADRHSYVKDLTVNGIGVGRGSGNHINSTTLGNWSLQNATGDQNTAIGYATLTANTTGTQNTALGSQSLSTNLTGKFNTGLGDSSLNKLEAGNNNTALGYQAGFTLTSGANNTLIGAKAQPSSPTVSNEVTIGDDDVTKTRLRGQVLISRDEPDNSGVKDSLIIQNTADQAGDGSAIKFLCGQSTNTGAQITAVGRSFNEADLILTTGSTDAIKINHDSTIRLQVKDADGDIIKIIPDGRTYMYGVKDNEGAQTPNVVIGPDGQMFKSTTATYSAEEVELAIDKKVAVKDKIIEKLEARLTKLEARIK